jgi:hypothetical protein
MEQTMRDTPTHSQAAISLGELLDECLGALTARGRDIAYRNDHCRVIEAYCQSNQISDDLRQLLGRVADALASDARRGMLMPSERIAGRDELVSKISKALRGIGAPAFVYHGTIFGRLRSIARDGLALGRHAKWSDRPDIRELCAGAIFFTTT